MKVNVKTKNITDTPLSLIDFTVYSMMEIVIEDLVALF